MKFNLFSKNLSAAQQLNLMLGGTVLILGLGLVVCIYRMTSQHETTVVVPPGLSGPVRIDWDKADARYLEDMGQFFATMLGGITPRNANYIAERLSSMVCRPLYPVIRRNILSAAKDPAFISSGSSQAFVMTEAPKYEYETGLVFIVGETRIYTGNGAPKTNPMVYEMDIRIVERRPILCGITNYSGREPRTLEWKAKNPGWDTPKPEQF